MFFKKDGRCISSMSLVNLVFSSNHTSVCTIFKRVITTLLHIQFFFNLLRSFKKPYQCSIFKNSQTEEKSFSELLALIDDTLFK